VIRNIIFDWCGTLMDDLPAVWKATCRVFERAGVATLSLDDFRTHFELPFIGFYESHVPGVPIEQLEAWFHEAFSAEQDSVKPLAHAPQFLEFCRSKGLRCFVLSAIHPKHFALHLRKSGFAPYFEATYTGIWDKREEIHQLITRHGIDPAQTLYIGDMEHDVETAHHAAIPACAVLTGFKGPEALKQANPELLVEHLGELQTLMENTCMDPLAEPNHGSHAAQSPFPIPTVGALIHDQVGNVLMVRTHKWSDKWGIPGGKIQRGEASEEALRREIMEETGLAIENIAWVMVQDAINPPEFYRKAHFLLLNYTAQCAGDQPGVRLNEEAQAYCWVTPQEAKKMDLNQATRRLLETTHPATKTSKEATHA
jgi:phosphoglycolate phosphatase